MRAASNNVRITDVDTSWTNNTQIKSYLNSDGKINDRNFTKKQKIEWMDQANKSNRYNRHSGPNEGDFVGCKVLRTTPESFSVDDGML